MGVSLVTQCIVMPDKENKVDTVLAIKGNVLTILSSSNTTEHFSYKGEW